MITLKLACILGTAIIRYKRNRTSKFRVPLSTLDLERLKGLHVSSAFEEIRNSLLRAHAHCVRVRAKFLHASFQTLVS